MKILFWGTAEFAVPSLRALDDEGFEVVAVVTQPDRPAGRGQRLTPSAVRIAATEMGLPIFTPERPRGEEFVSTLRAFEPDVSVVLAYGHILRPEVLDVPRRGSINVHASLLPELRGAAPITWAIARGYEETGVTIIRMVEAMDAGPILHALKERIHPDDTASGLSSRLAEIGAAALVEALALISVGGIEGVEQDHDAATFAPKIDRETARIDWSLPAEEIGRHVRAMDSVPGAWSMLAGAAVKLFGPTPSPDPAGAAPAPHPVVNGGPPQPEGPALPGTVLAADPAAGVLVAAGVGSVLFVQAQPAGKRRMSAADWINGRGVEPGQRFE